MSEPITRTTARKVASRGRLELALALYLARTQQYRWFSLNSPIGPANTHMDVIHGEFNDRVQRAREHCMRYGLTHKQLSNYDDIAVRAFGLKSDLWKAAHLRMRDVMFAFQHDFKRPVLELAVRKYVNVVNDIQRCDEIRHSSQPQRRPFPKYTRK